MNAVIGLSHFCLLNDLFDACPQLFVDSNFSFLKWETHAPPLTFYCELCLIVINDAPSSSTRSLQKLLTAAVGLWEPCSSSARAHSGVAAQLIFSAVVHVASYVAAAFWLMMFGFNFEEGLLGPLLPLAC